MRALIVEDDAATRACWSLRRATGTTTCRPFADAESVWAALSAGAEPGAFDLAVVDIGLPGQDGIAFCRQFRRHAAGRHAIILLVTADERAETLEAALEAGAHDYVIKPIERRRFAVRLAIAEQRSLANATSRYSREALRESEHRFEAFMTNSPALAFIKDASRPFPLREPPLPRSLRRSPKATSSGAPSTRSSTRPSRRRCWPTTST